jgi:hypothetical protein
MEGPREADINVTIPQFLLNQTATISLYAGSNAYGDIWLTPNEVKCRFEPLIQNVVDNYGNEVTSTARMFVNPPNAVNTESLIVFDGVKYSAISCQKQFAMSTYSHTEVLLKGIK